MLFRRSFCLVLLAACDDEPADLPLEAGGPVAEMRVEAGVEVELPLALDAGLDAAPIELDASSPSTPDASAPDAASVVDAGVLDCSSLGLTYDNYGAEFLYLWCNFCHAKQEPTFPTLEAVRQWAPAMRIATLDARSMPPSGNANYLRDNQREQFARWLDCGAP